MRRRLVTTTIDAQTEGRCSIAVYAINHGRRFLEIDRESDVLLVDYSPLKVLALGPLEEYLSDLR